MSYECRSHRCMRQIHDPSDGEFCNSDCEIAYLGEELQRLIEINKLTKSQLELAGKRLSMNWHDFVRPYYENTFEEHLKVFDNRITELEHYGGERIVNKYNEYMKKESKI